MALTERELMKQGFDQMEKHFDDFNRRLTGMMWLIGAGARGSRDSEVS